MNNPANNLTTDIINKATWLLQQLVDKGVLAPNTAGHLAVFDTRVSVQEPRRFTHLGTVNEMAARSRTHAHLHGRVLAQTSAEFASSWDVYLARGGHVHGAVRASAPNTHIVLAFQGLSEAPQNEAFLVLLMEELGLRQGLPCWHRSGSHPHYRQMRDALQAHETS